MQDLRTQLSSRIVITDADRESKKLLRHFVDQARFTSSRTLDNRKRTRVTALVVQAEHVSDGLLHKKLASPMKLDSKALCTLFFTIGKVK
jgi:hypothetical protein